MGDYSVEVEPMGKPRMTRRDRWKKRPVVLRYRGFCDELRLLLGGDLEKISKVNRFSYIRFYLKMPKSWSAKRKEKMKLSPHQQTPDLDNLLKAFFDALRVEDKQIYSIGELEKFWDKGGQIDFGIDE